MCSGKIGFLWPGLNAPLMVSGKVQSISQRDEEEQKALQLAKAEEQKQLDKRRRIRIKKERGWTGRSWGGVSLGPPDPGPNGGEIIMERMNILFSRNKICLVVSYLCILLITSYIHKWKAM